MLHDMEIYFARPISKIFILIGSYTYFYLAPPEI